MTILESIRSMGLDARLGSAGKVILVGLDNFQHKEALSLLASARERRSSLYWELVTKGDICCAKCSYFKPDLIGDTPHALGTCGGEPWDGFNGQWPKKRHVCVGFTSLFH